jgi:hypothetical protein
VLKRLLILQGLTDIVNKYPPGSDQYNKAAQTLASLHNTVNMENASLATNAESQNQFLKMISGAGQQNPAQQSTNPEQQFQQRQNILPVLGPQGVERQKYEQEHHVPGYSGQTSRPVQPEMNDKIQAMSVLDDKGKDVLNFVKQNKGTWNPQKQAIAEQKVDEMKNFYNASIGGGALTEGRLNWYDEQFKKDPTGIISQLRGSTAKMQEMVDSNAKRLKEQLSGPGGLGLPESKQQPSAPQNIPEGTKGTNKKTGEKMIRKNGAWVTQ